MTKSRQTRRVAIKRILHKDRLQREREKDEEHHQYQVTYNRKGLTDPDAQHFDAKEVRRTEQMPSSMFLTYNHALGPPFHILLDTNFINFSMQNKLEIIPSMMDCLMAKCVPCVCDCVLAEMEKLGKKFRIALRLARDPRFQRLHCGSTYADDCIVDRITQHRIYIVATCDKDLKRRIRKIPGVPIMYISRHRYTIERLPEAFGAPN